MKKVVYIFAFLLFPLSGFTQSYFQQEVNYTIHVTLDDVKNELTADERIEYINNSASELTFIYMHLWPNAYKDNTTPLAKEFLINGDNSFYHSKAEERGFIDQLEFKIDGQPAKWEFLKDSIDICKLYLNAPLKSGSKIIITTPFHVKIPSGEFSRLGHIGQSYQITQWYPKPAVYDKNGWNYMPYLTQGEFYSEFGSFDVSITLPKNYVLGATGDMVDGEKELEWLNHKVKETEAITSYDSKDLAFPASDTETKTLRFKQSNVHDFAWFCDKRYHVLKGEVETPHTKRKVTTWVMFTNSEGDLWKKSIPYVNDAIYYYSLWNGDYPYNHCTAVDGTISAGGGMEYPNITVIGKSQNAFLLEMVIAHEVGHNWFYGMLGSNEREHPWLDEGMNSFNELRYVKTKYSERKLIGKFGDNSVGKAFDLSSYKQKAQYELSYLFSAAKNEDQPIELPAYKYTGVNYGGIVYSKTAIVFDYLMAIVGEKEMDKAMQRYFDEWHFKHPQPEDLRKVLEQSTGKNLGWFFDDLINSTKKLDYKITSSKKQGDGSWNIGVKNKADIKGTLFLQGIKDKKVVKEAMYEGFEGKQTLSFPSGEFDHFKIDYAQDMPEINRNNNTIRARGVFKKVEPLKLQFLGSLDNPDKTQLFFTPAVGWNNYNRWMLGFAFYNNSVPQKKFEFVLMPMLSYSTNDFAGSGKVMYNMFPEGSLFQRISIGAAGARYAFDNAPFSNFNKIAPELNIEFKKKYAKSTNNHTLRYRNISIIKNDYYGNLPQSIYSYNYVNFNDITYQFHKKSTLTPYIVNVNVQQGEGIMKTSLTANYTYNFKNKNKGVDIRFFAGTFVELSPPKTVWGSITQYLDRSPYLFRLSGQTGSQDYLYDNIFLGRSETTGVLANQFTETDGGFKFYSTVGQTSEWLTALNIKSSIGNLKLPLKLYADLGLTAYNWSNKTQPVYNAGVCISFAKNIFEIYFPLILSKDLQDYKDVNNLEYAETIRFTLNLNLLNPFDIIKSL
ncbi:MAG: M1 family metallopeptidase [Bacteroidota bacterium]